MSTEQRLRDYLTRDEVTLLLRAARKSPRHAMRNYAMILIAYRHGLRASEVVNFAYSAVMHSSGSYAATGTAVVLSFGEPMQ